MRLDQLLLCSAAKQRFHVKTAGSALFLVVLTMLVTIAIFAAASTQAATASNAKSSLGMNLVGVSYYSSEQPFLNIFKTGGSWITHSTQTWDTNEEQYLNLDANGYPITLTVANDPNAQKFTSIGVLMLRSLPNTANGYYPSGKYIVLYTGQGTMTYGGDAVLVSRVAGQDTINVATATIGGIELRITATDPNRTGNYLRNIQVVQASNLSALNAGQVFSPKFLGLMKNFRAIRFMEWFVTNGNTLSSWSNRPLPANAFWGTNKGVPIEIALQLANALSADAWLTVPVMADDNYLTQMATLVKGQLGSSQKAYIELSNEVWNGIYSQNAYSISQGLASFPAAPNKWYAGWEWYGMRVAQMGDIWYSVYGNSAFNSRVVIVMAGQYSNTVVLTEELSTPDWKGAGNGPAANHHICAAAIAPYFFGVLSAGDLKTMLSTPDGGLTDMFDSLYSQSGFSSVVTGGWLAQTKKWVDQQVSALAPFKLPLLAYEGGQSLEGFSTYLDGSPVVNLYIAVNRDPRMAAAYTAYFNNWKASGGTMFMHFNDADPPSQYGQWGALESFMQTTNPLASAPPKWQSIQNFISNNDCWWTGCTNAITTTVATPMAPSNLKVEQR
jgi:hypothetical protein